MDYYFRNLEKESTTRAHYGGFFIRNIQGLNYSDQNEAAEFIYFEHLVVLYFIRFYVLQLVCFLFLIKGVVIVCSLYICFYLFNTFIIQHAIVQL